MTACERCWAEYRRRSLFDKSVEYRDVLAKNEGRCTPRDMCGQLHIIPLGATACRCGKRVHADGFVDEREVGDG